MSTAAEIPKDNQPLPVSSDEAVIRSAAGTEIAQVGQTAIECLRSNLAGWVALKPLCEKLGVGFEAQRKRLQAIAGEHLIERAQAAGGHFHV